MAVTRTSRRRMIAAALTVAVVFFVMTGPAGAVKASHPEPKGLLLSLDAATGHERWRTTTPPVLDLFDVSKRAIVGRASSCGSGDFRTVAYRVSDGRERWTHAASFDGLTQTAAGADRSGVVVVALKTQVQGRDAVSGALRWQLAVPALSWVEATADSVYLGVHSKKRRSADVMAFDRSSGRSRWMKTVAPRGQAFDAPSILAGDGVVAASVPRENAFPINLDVSVLDARTGRELWRATGTPQSAGGGVVTLFHPAGSGPAGLEARDATSGRMLWQHASEAHVVQPTGGLLLLGDASTISALDARTGALQWAKSYDATSVTVGKTVVVAIGRNELVAVDVHSGAERWRALLPGDGLVSTNSVIFESGSVYVTRGCSPTD